MPRTGPLFRTLPFLIITAALAAGACAGPSKRDAAKALVRQADEWYGYAKFNEAGKLYADALSAEPDLPEAALGLANVRRVQCSMELEHYVDGDAKKGIDIDSVRKLYQESVRWFEVADRMRSDYRDVHYGLGLLYFTLATNKTLPPTPEWNAARRNWLDATREAFERAVKLAPDQGAPQEYLAQIYNLIGADLAARGDAAGAIETLGRARASCDAFLAWFWKQRRLREPDPKGFDERVKAFEDLKVDIDVVVARLRGGTAAEANGAPPPPR